jgi:hypothetical protein
MARLSRTIGWNKDAMKPRTPGRGEPRQSGAPRQRVGAAGKLGATMPLKFVLRVNVIAFLWLFGSAFCWSHEPSQFNNAWLVGLLGCMFASLAEDVPGFRYVNAALGIWLVASVQVLPVQTALTSWTSAAVGLVAQVALLASTTGPSSSSRHNDTVGQPWRAAAVRDDEQ